MGPSNRTVTPCTPKVFLLLVLNPWKNKLVGDFHGCWQAGEPWCHRGEELGSFSPSLSFGGSGVIRGSLPCCTAGLGAAVSRLGCLGGECKAVGWAAGDEGADAELLPACVCSTSPLGLAKYQELISRVQVEELPWQNVAVERGY